MIGIIKFPRDIIPGKIGQWNNNIKIIKKYISNKNWQNLRKIEYSWLSLVLANSR